MQMGFSRPLCDSRATCFITRVLFRDARLLIVVNMNALLLFATPRSGRDSLTGDILIARTVHGICPVSGICLSTNFKLLQYFWNG